MDSASTHAAHSPAARGLSGPEVTQAPPSQTMRKVRSLRKRLRQIQKLEESRSAGRSIDGNQDLKLSRKAQLEEQLAQVEAAAATEREQFEATESQGQELKDKSEACDQEDHSGYSNQQEMNSDQARLRWTFNEEDEEMLDQQQELLAQGRCGGKGTGSEGAPPLQEVHCPPSASVPDMDTDMHALVYCGPYPFTLQTACLPLPVPLSLPLTQLACAGPSPFHGQWLEDQVQWSPSPSSASVPAESETESTRASDTPSLELQSPDEADAQSDFVVGARAGESGRGWAATREVAAEVGHVARAGAGEANVEWVFPPGSADTATLTLALKAGGYARDRAISQLKGSVARHTFEADGCRLIQTAICVAENEVAGLVAGEMRGQVREAVRSPHGNYVIQTIIQKLPAHMSSFVVEELRGAAVKFAKHRFGCRIFCRLAEHPGSSAACGSGSRRGGGPLELLFEELLDKATELSKHTFGHYVLETMLEHMPSSRQRILEALVDDGEDTLESVCHRSASHVIESALGHCEEPERRRLISSIVGRGRARVLRLAENPYGAYVLKTLFRPEYRKYELCVAAYNHIVQSKAAMQSKYVHRLLQQDANIKFGQRAEEEI